MALLLFTNFSFFSGVDRLERLKAVPLRLMAIDRFLEENPEWIGKVVFALIGISAGERGIDYKQTVHDVKILVQRINEKYLSTTPFVIYFEERSESNFRLAQRLPYFAASDVLLMAATRDGLNRYPMEFALAREQNGNLVKSGAIPKTERLGGSGQPNEGLVIISEFISSARVMRGALVVNPWRVDEVTHCLSQVLTMGDEERAERSRRNMEFSARVTSGSWAKYVLSDLKSTEILTDPNSTYAVGFGLQYKIMNLKAGFQPLDTKEIAKAFRVAHYRLILVDWGGTIVPNTDKIDKLHAFALATGHASQEGPSSELTAVLEAICSDPKNCVFVVSGKEMRAVGTFFGNIKNLGLAAEHGLYYRWPRDIEPHQQQLYGHHNKEHHQHHSRHHNTHHKEQQKHPVSHQDEHQVKHNQSEDQEQDGSNSKLKWQSIVHISDNSWKESCKIVMDIYVQRTHGTYIEQKGSALIWQFSDADPEFGFLQSKELEDHLHSILSAHPVEIIRGGGVSDGYIEVRPAGANKGLFLEHALNTMKSQNMEPDFILAVGDDISDEPMFERVSQLLQDDPNLNCFSVTVGKKPTAAKSYVDDSNSVLELLTLFTKAMQRDKKHASLTDIPSHHAHHLAHHGNDLNSFASHFKSSLENSQPLGSLQTSHSNPKMMRSTSDGALTTSTLDQPHVSDCRGILSFHFLYSFCHVGNA
jgi:trehalose 6-phosphate synthase/phosphatase